MKLMLTALLLLVTFPAVVGTAAATVATAPHPAPATRLFSWVPAGGFPDRFPYGQCTWWAAYNRHVTWNGNADEWLANAKRLGLPTNSAPSVGAIAVYRPGGGYSDLYGHVAVVIAVGAGTYTVSEMNFIGWGRVSTRSVPWPDRHVEGFIPAQEDQ
jgi:surface antigen